MPEPTETPKRKRGWLSFSLRTILLWMTLVSAALAYWTYQANQQRTVVKWIEEHGARVAYDFEYDKNGSSIDDGRPPGPQWLRDVLGDDYLGNVVFADFQYYPVDEVGPLGKLTHLRYLELCDSTEVEDIGPLARLKCLRYLGLSGTQVSDLSPVAGMDDLRRLYLGRTEVSDLTPLAGLTNLERLNLYHTPVSDLSPLEKLTSLTSLDLHATNVTQDQVDHLQQALPDCDIFWLPPD